MAAETESRRDGRFVVILAAALIAGGLSGLAVWKLGSLFTYPPEIQAKIINPNAELDVQEMAAMDRENLWKNMAMCGALAGALFAGLLGMAAGWLRSGLVTGTFVGSIIGLLLGGVGGYLGATAWQITVDQRLFLGEGGDKTLMHAAIANSILWAAVGLAAGIAMGLGQPANKRVGGIVAAVLGGILSAWLFFTFASLAVPKARIGMPIPEDVQDTSTLIARIAWAVIPAITIGLFAMVGTAPDPPPAEKEEESGAQEAEGE